MRKQFCIVLLTLAVSQVEANDCPEHFVSIGKFCYHFSDIKENWDGARGLCAGIGSLKNEHIIPAVLDLGSPRDNQLLLNEVRNNSKEHWLGGYRKQRGNSESCVSKTWQWIYPKGKYIDLLANYWMNNHPETKGDCVEATDGRGRKSYSLTKSSGECVKTNNIARGRLYIQTEECSKRLNVICQIIPKEFGFRDVGGNKFYFSEENAHSKLTWSAARNVCQSIIPPEQFDHVDLAILDISTGQELLKMIAKHGRDVWLGGKKFKEHANTMLWVDGSEISKTSYFIDSDIRYPSQLLDEDYYRRNFYYNHLYTYARISSFAGKSKATLYFTQCYGNPCSSAVSQGVKIDFVCQAYKNQTLTMT